MAHFAEIDTDGTVLTVIVVSNDDCAGGDFPDSEAAGQAFLSSLPGYEDKSFKQTSYSHSFRKQYAAIGGKYDSASDVFVQRQPYPSWTLDENHDWQPPVPKPEGWHNWDEEAQSWVAVTPG